MLTIGRLQVRRRRSPPPRRSRSLLHADPGALLVAVGPTGGGPVGEAAAATGGRVLAAGVSRTSRTSCVRPTCSSRPTRARRAPPRSRLPRPVSRSSPGGPTPTRRGSWAAAAPRRGCGRWSRTRSPCGARATRRRSRTGRAPGSGSDHAADRWRRRCSSPRGRDPPGPRPPLRARRAAAGRRSRSTSCCTACTRAPATGSRSRPWRSLARAVRRARALAALVAGASCRASPGDHPPRALALAVRPPRPAPARKRRRRALGRC